jgi:hypothetical protein
MRLLPGDDLVASCQYVTTRAIHIAVAPDKVWPRLVQVGFSKAGFYSNDLLDNAAHPSARRIIPELQTPELALGADVQHSKRNDRVQNRRSASEQLPRMGEAR